MITVFNANNIAQQLFFKKGFAALQEKGIALSEQESVAKRFLSLDGYFAHMQDLILINPIYAMLPSDEEPFMIDANARTITIPASFNKCASVVGDDMCEIATFVVDRYYDYVDLATTNICIQWATKNGAEGMSHVTLIDTESIPGKIRFGWPLTSHITSEAGTVTFAVRFFLKDDNQEIKYVLNTLKASIVIREGLQVSGDNVTVESNNDLFTAFVRNSNRPSFPIPAPITWGKPGLDVEGPKKIAESERVDLETGVVEAANSLKIRAQAVVEDNGHLIYNWYFLSDEPNSLPEKLTNDDERYNIEEEFVKIEPRPTKRNGAEQYFTNDGSGYELVVGDLPDEDLYERYTVLTIDPNSNSQNITGEYWATAINYVGDSYISLGIDPTTGEVIQVEAQNHSPENPSSHCKVLGPVVVEFKDNLAKNKFLDKNGKVQLEVAPVRDAGDPLLTYSWYYSDTEIKEVPVDEAGVPTATDDKMADAANPSLEASTPGWYYAHINSKLNRKEKNAVSDICRVINEPAVPQLAQMSYAPWTDAAFENAEEYFARDNVWNVVDKEHEMGDTVVNRQGDVTRLKVDFQLDDTGAASLNNKLLTDKITYQWFVITPDNNVRPIEEADADVLDNGLVLAGCPINTNYLDVRCIQNQTKYSYFCVVTNYLGDDDDAKKKTAVFGKDNYEVIFQIW